MSTTPTSPNPSKRPKRPAPERRPPAPVRTQLPASRARSREVVHRHGFVFAIAAALAVSALSLLYPSTPSYDPWEWIQWGRDITQLELNTNTGPSWKPLPVLFTTLFAPFGDAAPDLWLVIARAGGLLSLLMCFRLANHLVGGRAGYVAGFVAAAAMALSTY